MNDFSPPRPGRLRDDSLDQLVIDATLKLIDEDRNVTVSAVVKESGVSRTAVYQRWPSMTDLVADALDQGRGPLEVDPAEDIKSALAAAIFPPLGTSDEGYPLRRFRKRIELMMGDHELQLSYWKSHVEPRRRPVIEALRAAQERGEIRADVDVESVLDAIYGMFYYQIVVRGASVLTADVRRRCMEAYELIWRGIR